MSSERGIPPTYSFAHFIMQALMAARAQGLDPAGRERGIITQEDATDAVLQIAAVVDEWLQSGLLPEGKAMHIMMMLAALREHVQPLPAPGEDGSGEQDLRAHLQEISDMLREARQAL